MQELNIEIAQLKKDRLDELLVMCTDKQRAFFDNIFPTGPSEEQFETAIGLVERTVKDNAPARPKPKPRRRRDG